MPDDWKRVTALFTAALERPPTERDGFLTEACGGDDGLRREVISLLDAHARAGGFLETPVEEAAALRASALGPSLEGRLVGPYRVEREIGRGGMGVVYLAEDTRLGRKVALKSLAPEIMSDERRRNRLRREARAAATLSHPGIATVYALEEIEDQLFIATEYVQGRTLRAELRHGSMPAAEVVEIGIRVASALEAAHARGVVHRDLKPENVIRTEDGGVKILDFGIAWVDLAEAGSGAELSRLTESGAVMGTPSYMSPEQIEGGTIDARADVFSLGVVLYELLCGSNPFEAHTPLATAARIMATDPPPLAASNVSAPPALEHIVRKCLAKDREERYQRASDVARDLEAIQRQVGRMRVAMPAAPRQLLAQSGGLTGARAWWVAHQVTVMTLYTLMTFPAWEVRGWSGGYWGLALFLGLIACAVVNGVLRVHLLFTARFNPSAVGTELRRNMPWIARSDIAVAAVLLLAALTVAASHTRTAAWLAAVAVGAAVVALVVEPVTVQAAFPRRSSGSGRRTPPGPVPSRKSDS
jgi:tRNA A-37 threonylcarbamoyl transferase component Bud32